MKAPPNGFVAGSEEGTGERKGIINSELWHACAGPLVSLPPVGSLVVYFPQGHSEQVAASLQKGIDCIPSYPNLPSKLICMLHNVNLHADGETDEVYAQMTLQPVSKHDKEALLASDLGLKQNRQPSEFFCKTLTASDTSTHGGFSVPRRAAEKIFPPLDFSMQPPAQELVARDLHNNAWRFRHIYRGQPKRHLLTTGWSVFVSTKRLFAGDSVLFIRDEKSQLLLGIRHANRQQPALSSSVISSDSMHIGILAAAAHAAANNSPFTIFYNPRASPSEFVIPLAKYNKAMYTQVSLGMRFRMMFETEESGVRRYMGTITAMSDLDPIRWKDSQWRNLQVGWDESTTGERPSRVSIWDIEPVVTPFYICPPPFFRPKFCNSTGMPDDDIPWIGDDFGMRDSTNSIFPGMNLVQWMSMQHNNQFPAAQSKFISSMVSSAAMHSSLSADNPSKLLNFQDPVLAAHSLHFNKSNQHNQVSQFQQTAPAWPQQQQLHHQTPINLQQQQPPPPSQQQQQPEQQLQQQQQRQQQNQQQVLQPAHANNGVVSKQTFGQNSQQALMMPQLQQHHVLTGNLQPQQNIHVADRNSFQLASLPQDLQFHQVEQQSGLLQRHQIQQMQLQHPPTQLLQHGFPQRPQAQPQVQQSPLHNLSEHQIQLKALQKLQQQQQQLLLPPASPHLQPQVSQQQLDNQQHHQLQQLPSYHHQQQQQLISSGFSTATIMQQQSQQIPMNQPQIQHSKAHVSGRVHSAITDGDAKSCSTSPSSENHQIPTSKIQNKEQHRSAILAGDSMIESASHFVQEQNRYDTKAKHQLSNSSKRIDQLEYRSTITDQLEGSSSATSYCLDAASLHQNFTPPNLCLEGDQLHIPNNLPFADNIDGLAPDTLLSRAFDSGKDFQNLLSNYGGTPRDIETELSTAEISSQSFGVPDTSLKPGCSNDVAVYEAGVLGSSDLWANQTQRMRTYTKVQKRGSVGRCIDVTHYRGYDDLRHELARMFGIEGQLEDPQRTEWKLVYVDHENDILLVGDDPWEEFVSCVQSIKILSSSEVQQMSLEEDLGQVPISNQACSGTDSGNAWR